MNAQDEIERLKREVERLQEALRTSEHECRKTDAPLSQFTTGDSLINNLEFITDLARFAEGLYTQQDVKKKYRFDDDAWAKLGKDETLIEAIQAEKVRRIRNGSSAREKAQQLFVKAPDVLDSILSDDKASPRYRIEASKELRMVANNGPETIPAADRFIITINLGEDHKLVINKPIAVGPDDGEIINHEPQAMIAAKKDENDGPV